MSRFDTNLRARTGSNPRPVETETGPIIHSISKAERTFRWMREFRSEPRFEIAPASSGFDPNSPDRAA